MKPNKLQIVSAILSVISFGLSMLQSSMDWKMTEECVREEVKTALLEEKEKNEV